MKIAVFVLFVKDKNVNEANILHVFEYRCFTKELLMLRCGYSKSLKSFLLKRNILLLIKSEGHPDQCAQTLQRVGEKGDT